MPRFENIPEKEEGDLSQWLTPENAKAMLDVLKDTLPKQEHIKNQGDEITPEQVLRVWGKLNSTEQMLAQIRDEEKFQRAFEIYKRNPLKQNTTLIRAIHKLIAAHDPRAALIEKEN